MSLVDPAFRALSEPHRRMILDLLRERPRPVGELQRQLRLSQPATSKHLRILRDVGLVEARVQQQQRVYRVRVEPLRHVEQWLAPYRRLWASSLNRLEAALEADTLEEKRR